MVMALVKLKKLSYVKPG